MKHVTYILFILSVIFLDTSHAVDLSTTAYRADFLRGSKSELMSVTKGGVTDSKEIKYGEKNWSAQVLEMKGLRFELKRGSQDRLIITRKDKKKIEELTFQRQPKSRKFALAKHQVFPVRKLYHEPEACFLPGQNQRILDLLNGTVKAEEVELYKKKFDSSCKNLPNGMGDKLAEVLASMTSENSKIKYCLEEQIGLKEVKFLRASILGADSRFSCQPKVKEKSNYDEASGEITLNADAFPGGQQFNVQVGLHEILHASCSDFQKPTAEAEKKVGEVVSACLSGESAKKLSPKEELYKLIDGYQGALEQEQQKNPQDGKRISEIKSAIDNLGRMTKIESFDTLKSEVDGLKEGCKNLSAPESCFKNLDAFSIKLPNQSLAEDREAAAATVAKGPAIPEAEVKTGGSGISEAPTEHNIASGPPPSARPAEVVTEIAKQMPSAPEVQKKSDEVFRPIESRPEIESANRVAEASFKNGATSFDLPVPKDLSQAPTIEYPSSAKNLADFVVGVGAGLKNSFASAPQNMQASRSASRAPASIGTDTSDNSSGDGSRRSSVNNINLPKPVSLAGPSSPNAKPRVLAKGFDPNAIDNSPSEEPTPVAQASKENLRAPASVGGEASRDAQGRASSIAPNAVGSAPTSFGSASPAFDSGNRGGDSRRAAMPLAKVRQMIAKAKPAQLVQYAKENPEFRLAIDEYGIVIKQDAKVLLAPSAKPNSGQPEIWLFDQKKNQWLRQ